MVYRVAILHDCVYELVAFLSLREVRVIRNAAILRLWFYCLTYKRIGGGGGHPFEVRGTLPACSCGPSIGAISRPLERRGATHEEIIIVGLHTALLVPYGFSNGDCNLLACLWSTAQGGTPRVHWILQCLRYAGQPLCGSHQDGRAVPLVGPQ